MLSAFIMACIQRWVATSGRAVDFQQYPYLRGPMADSNVIGDRFYETVAQQEGLRIERPESGGLLANFRAVLDPGSPNYGGLDPGVTEFYEHTTRYKLDVWSQWYAPISWAAKLLIRMVSTDMQQLNIPMDPLETSYGMSSDIIQLHHPEHGLTYTCWLRQSIKTNRVVYAGFYSACQVGDAPYQHVRVVFPLPNGNVTVILKVEVQPDGSVKLISRGRHFGGAGYYRMHRKPDGTVVAKMIPIHEVIHVFRDKSGTMRTDHYFRWWGKRFLQLHYKVGELSAERNA